MTEQHRACLRSVVIGAGAHLPANVVTNKDLEATIATSDDWIVQRTGITRRHIAGEGETTSTLGLAAARNALVDAKLAANDIDLVIVATSTPDFTFPSVATQIQAGLGMTRGAAFDVQAVCSGFVFAVATADKFLISGSHKRALVVGAETFSRILDWEDRTTCVLFGDGAAAIVLEAQPGEGKTSDRGVLTSHLRSDGRHREKLYVDGGPSSTQTTGRLKMAGKDVFRHAVGMVTDVITDAFEATGTSAEDLDWFVPHQANRRIIDASADKLGIEPSESCRHRRPARQHVRRVDPLGAFRGARRRAYQKGRPRHDRGDGRWLHVGIGAHPLVAVGLPVSTTNVFLARPCLGMEICSFFAVGKRPGARSDLLGVAFVPGACATKDRSGEAS